MSDIESNYKWTKTWAKPLKIVPCGYLGKLNNGFLYSFLGEQFVATMKSNSSKVAMTSHMLLQKMHFIPGGFWGLCVCYDTSGSWWFWMHAGRYVNVDNADTDRWESFCLFCHNNHWWDQWHQMSWKTTTDNPVKCRYLCERSNSLS